jgi:hypothetical protein
MKGSTIFGIAALILTGAVVADIWSKPAGTAAAGNALANLWTPSLAAVSGQSVPVNLSKQ